MIKSSNSLSRKEMSRSTHRERLRIDTATSPHNRTSFQGIQTLSPHVQPSLRFLPTSSQNRTHREGFKSPIGTIPNIDNPESRMGPKNHENNDLKQSRLLGPDNINETKMNQTDLSFRFSRARRATPLKAQTVVPRSNIGSMSLDKKLERMRTVGNPLLSSPKVLGSEPGSALKSATSKYSYPQQTLVFIPQDIEELSGSNGQSAGFKSFDELAKTTKSIHSEMLQSVLVQDIDLRTTYHKSPVLATNQLGVIQQILKLNEMQRSHYDEHCQSQEQKIMAMTIQDFQKKSPKFRRAPLIRVSPSRKLITNLHEFVDQNNDSGTLPGLSDQIARDSSKEKTEAYGSYNSLDTTNDGHSKKRAAFGNLKFFWHFCNEDRGQWRPAPRESSSLTAVGNYFVLYGGISDKVIDTTSIYDPIRDTWLAPDLKGDVPLTGRHSHTACEYQGKVVIFGGGYGYSALTHVRECRNDIYTFDIDKYEWHAIKPYGVQISARRNHAAAMGEKGMYVYAGIDTDGEYLNDLWVFNFKTNRWIHLETKRDKQPGQAFHTMCACFIDKSQFLPNSKKTLNFQEGLYVFGGKDGEGGVLNTLKMVPLSSEIFEWKYPTTKGPVPPARFDHVMLFYEPMRILLIHGGRNNSSFTSMSTTSLEDIRILRLDTMTWDMSSAIGNVPTMGRSRHSATLLGNTIAIFGGVGYNEYASPEIKLIEANQLNVWKLTKDYEAKSKRTGNIMNRIVPEIFTENQEELVVHQRPKSRETDLSEHMEAGQQSHKRLEITKLAPIVQNPQGEPNHTSKVIANVKHLVSSNGFENTLKRLNKIEGERMKLKKLGYI